MSSDLIPAPSDDLVALAAQINAEYAAAYEERDAALDRARSAWTRVIRAGHLLRAAKDQLPHGAWLPWLREHTVIPPRTAQNWMRLAANAPRVAHLGGEGQALRFLASPRFVSEPEAEPEPAREPEPPPAPVEPPQRARTEPDALPPLPGAGAQHRPAAEAALRSADAALARAPVPAVPEERMDAAQKSEEKTAAAGRNDVVIAGQWHRLLTQWRGLAALEPEALVRAVGAARLGEEIPPVLEVLQRLLAAALDPWPALITVWWDAYGEQEIGTPEALALIVEHGLTWDWGEAPDERRRRVALGKALAARQGTIIGEHQICRSARKRHNSQLWSLRAMGRDMPCR